MSPQPTVVVGIGECRISSNPESLLVTYALGSCIAVAVWDPVAHVGGLLHYLLPDSAMDQNTGGPSKTPYRYADTGTPRLLEEVCRQGAQKRRLIIRIAGGASVLDDEGMFNIGRRNYAALRKILWREGIMIHGEDVGGGLSRTVRLEVGSGRFWIHQPGAAPRELAPRVGGGQR